jgi:hypothetical protein
MANTTIQLKSSTVTAAPTSLARAEPAYSYASNTFFIGSPDGTGSIAIGGKFYLDQQQTIFNSVNAAFTAANSGAAQSGAYNHANSAFIHANSAFASANNIDGVNVTQNNSIASAFVHANAAFVSANNIDGVNVTQNNSIAAAFVHANAAFLAANNATDTYVRNHANAAFARANNSVDANNGGTITGDVIINANLFVNGTTTFVNTVNQLIGDNIITLNADLPQGGTPTQDSGIEVERGVQPNSSFLWIESAGKWSANNGNTSFYLNPSIDTGTGGSISGALGVTGNVYAGNVIANSAFTSLGGTTKLELTDIGIVAIAVAGQSYGFGASGIESTQGIYGGAYGRNRLSLNNETNLLSTNFDTVKIQTGNDGRVDNEFTFANNAFTAPGRITAGSTVIGGINVVPQLASAYNHANAAFLAANTGSSAVAAFNQANSAFFHANSSFFHANSSFFHANAAFSTANSAASAASSAQGTADSAASAASAAQGTADGAVAVNVTQNTNITSANNTAVAAFKHANAAFAAANTVATASAAVFNGVGDGSTVSFNLGYAPVSDGSASVVSIDGLVQYETTYTITPANSSINFSDAPGAGERIRVLAYTSVNPYLLGATGVTAGDYGTAASVAAFKVAANGQITSANNTAIAIGAGAITSGTLEVARGGTGAGTFTTNGVLLGQGTGAFQTASSSTEGHVLTINASGVPTFAMVSGGTF